MFYQYKGTLVTASSKQEAVHKIIAKISVDNLRKNYDNAFNYCKKLKINPCNEFDDSGEGGLFFSFGVNNDWNTVSVKKNLFYYSLNDGETYNKHGITFEQLKKVLDKYAKDNKDKIGNNGVVTRMFM